MARNIESGGFGKFVGENFPAWLLLFCKENQGLEQVLSRIMVSTKIIQIISSTIKRTNNQKPIDYNELSKNNLEQLFKKTKQIIINNYQLIKNLVNKISIVKNHQTTSNYYRHFKRIQKSMRR